jgi:hypothetical protein
VTTFDDLHDARLLALIADGDGRFSLRFKTDAGKMRYVILDSVERLRCENFREGDIVLSVSLTSEVAVGDAELHWILGIEPNDETAYVRQLREQIARGELALFEIVPSYGEEIKAIVGDTTRGP